MAEEMNRVTEVEVARFSDDVNAIKARVFWLMMPTFFILVAVLGLSVLTWIEVNAINNKIGAVEHSIENVNKNLKPKQAAEAEKKTPTAP
jgi:hypothetical protein